MLQLTLGSQSDPIKYMEFLFTLHIKMEISRYYYVKVVFVYVVRSLLELLKKIDRGSNSFLSYKVQSMACLRT